MKKYLLLLALALWPTAIPDAFATGCPAGSPAGINCENYQGQVLDSVTGGTAQRKDQDRFNDHGINIKEFGAIGDGSSHRLSSIYGSLAAAQAVYSFVSDLTQEVDWAATQAAINYSFANGVQNVFCPAVTGQNSSYQLSNPIEVNQQANYQYSNPAWQSGSTYGNGDNVLYNGLSWQSLGTFNVGNPPTVASGYPANLAIAGNKLPFAQVTVTSASPGVVTLSGHGFAAGQPLIFIKQTYTDATYGSPALPTGINANEVYYVISTGLTSNTFEISTTPGGSAVNTSDTGSGVITVSTQVWQLTGGGGPDFSDRTNFIGDDGQGGSSEGCRYNVLSPTTVGFIIGPNNGNYIKSVTLVAANAQYRCQNPSSLVGFGNIADGAGTHVTVLDKIATNGFYTGWESNAGGGGNLGDSNTLQNVHLTSGCIGALVNEQENFINSIYDSTLDGNTVAAQAQLGTGLGIYGGNDSASVAQNNSFAITGVTGSVVSNVPLIQATITSPDSFLSNPMCGYNKQCAYSFFSLVTAHYGVIPLSLDGFNPATGVINLHVNGDFLGPYRNTFAAGGGSDFLTDIEAATTLYAAEAVTTYNGGNISVYGAHVENFSNTLAATTLANSSTLFGNTQATRLNNLLIDWDASGGDYVCCKQAPSASILAAFYAQQNMPFINGSSDIIVDNVNFFNVKSTERVLLEGGGYIDFRHTNASTPTQGSPSPIPPQGPGATWNQRYASNATFSNGGSVQSGAFGNGVFDNGSPWIASAFTTGDAWRAEGSIGASPTFGVRPAAYASPCVTPAQVTALGSAAITYISELSYISINAAGSGYAQGDTITLSGGTASTAAVVTVGSVNGSGGITSLENGFPDSHNSPSNNGSYSVEASSFTQGATSGSGTGATFNSPIWWVNYTTGYPLLWGGTIYHVCDYIGGSQTHYALSSTNLGYSYFVNLTTSNVPNLAWSSRAGSPVIYMNAEALELMFPGLVFSLTGTNTGSCLDTGTESFIVTEVHPYLGYVIVLNAGQDGTPYLPNWNGGTPGAECSGTTIGQASTNLVNPY